MWTGEIWPLSVSVGGNMTVVTALKAKDQGGPEIKVHIMMWPVTDANFETESFKQFGEKRFLTTSLMKWMWGLAEEPAVRSLFEHAAAELKKYL